MGPVVIGPSAEDDLREIADWKAASRKVLGYRAVNGTKLGRSRQADQPLNSQAKAAHKE
jgi:hypothetical protein